MKPDEHTQRLVNNLSPSNVSELLLASYYFSLDAKHFHHDTSLVIQKEGVKNDGNLPTKRSVFSTSTGMRFDVWRVPSTTYPNIFLNPANVDEKLLVKDVAYNRRE